MEKRKILIVDDEDFIREMLKDFLETIDITAATAANSREALTLQQQEDFALVFLDVNLENEKGIAVLRLLRDAGCQAPVIMMSGENEPLTAELKALGCVEFLYKPFKFDHYLAIVSRYLEIA